MISMGEVLFELDQNLRSKRHKLTLQEANALLNCKSKAIKDYTIGAALGAGVAWIATSKLSLFGRISFAAGASAFVGLWRLGNSLDSCLDHILSLDGSKMQTELANIMVTKYGDDPWRMRHISKQFYSERVFDDTTSDKPKIRWRYRNFFSDHVSHGQRTNESNSYSDSRGDSRNDSNVDYNRNTHSASNGARPSASLDFERRKSNVLTKQVPVKPAIEAMDPLDCVFGYPAMEKIHPPNTSTTSTRTRSQKRAHRKRRMRHQDVLSNPQYA